MSNGFVMPVKKKWFSRIHDPKGFLRKTQKVFSAECREQLRFGILGR
jgi:hypothetical protein